eukprot:889341-Amphidinium_carterae.1
MLSFSLFCELWACRPVCFIGAIIVVVIVVVLPFACHLQVLTSVADDSPPAVPSLTVTIAPENILTSTRQPQRARHAGPEVANKDTLSTPRGNNY